ncbi:hypothetical protein VPJ68_07815, partial [Parabacteroides distasonis]
DHTRWGAGYWHFNTRALYNGLLASNRPDIFRRYIEFYLRLTPAMQTHAHNVFGYTGGALKTAETIRWDGYPFKDLAPEDVRAVGGEQAIVERARVEVPVARAPTRVV